MSTEATPATNGGARHKISFADTNMPLTKTTAVALAAAAPLESTSAERCVVTFTDDATLSTTADALKTGL
jgi:hypothetical protein